MSKAIEISLPNFSDVEVKLRELSDLFNIDHGPLDEGTGRVVIWLKDGGDLGDLIQHLLVELVPFKVFTMNLASRRSQ